MAMQRCISVHIDGTGLDKILAESGIYGPATMCQILAGTHVNWAVDAYCILVSALLALKWSGSGQMLSTEKEEAVIKVRTEGTKASLDRTLELTGQDLKEGWRSRTLASRST